MRTSVKHRGGLAVVLLVSALGLSACGSDNDNDNNGSDGSNGSPTAGAPPPGAAAPPPVSESGVPASAGTSVAAYIDYLRGLQTDETSSPVLIGNFIAPVDDTAAPIPLGG